MDSQPAVQLPVQPTKQQKASLNPFKHMINGTRNLLQTNLLVLIGVILIQFVLSIAFTYLAYVFILNDISSLGFLTSPGSEGVGMIFVKVIVFILIASVISAYFGMAYNRVIVLGSRMQKTDIGSALKLSLSRLPLALGLLLFILLVIACAGFVVGLSGAISPILSVVAGLVLFILGIIFALRIVYTQFIVVEDDEPDGVMAAIKESALYWKSSDWALILYFITWVVLYIVFVMVMIGGIIKSSQSSSTSSFSETSSYSSSGSFSTASDDTAYNLGKEIPSTIVSTLVSVIGICGIASIYNEAREISGKNLLSKAPIAPVAAGPVPPVVVDTPAINSPVPPSIVTPGQPEA